MNILETKGITKIFKTGLRGRVQALDNVDLTVKQGEIFGLLGPNGAGKTTLVKILLGLIRPTAGEASLFGTNVHDHRIRSRLGYLPENPNFPPYLTGRKIMELFGALSSMPREKIEHRVDELLGMMNIKEAAGRKISTYSKGMIQRLGMAQALISDPDVIFLDEPTDGVDPIGRYDIRAALLHLKNAQKTVFLNSHLLSEVEMLCDRVVIFDKGRVLATGTLNELTGETNQYRIDCAALLPEYLEDISGTVVSGALNNGHFDVTVGSVEELNRVIDSIRRKGALIKSVVPARVSLESYFINLIKDVRRKGEAL